MANIKDFAVGVVVTAPSPLLSGNTATLRPGDAATMPPVPFYATASPPGSLSTLGTSEKVLVTAVNTTTEVITFDRAQTPTTAKEIGVGWIIANAVYADDVYGKNLTREAITPLEAANGSRVLFTVPDGKYIGSTLKVTINGIQQARGTDMVETNPDLGTFTLDFAYPTGTKISIDYDVSTGASGNAQTVDGYSASAIPTVNTIPVLGNTGKMPLKTLGLDFIQSNFTAAGARWASTNASFVDVPNCSATWVSPDYVTVLWLHYDVMALASVANGDVRLVVNSTVVGPTLYIDSGSPWARMGAAGFIVIPANTTCTIKFQGRANGGSTLNVTNENPIWLPAFTGIVIPA